MRRKCGNVRAEAFGQGTKHDKVRAEAFRQGAKHDKVRAEGFGQGAKHRNVRAEASGSLTVEAAFALPLMFFGIFTFLYVFSVFRLQLEVQRALTDMAAEYGKYGVWHSYFSAEDASEQMQLFQMLGLDQMVGYVADSALLSMDMRSRMKDRDVVRIVKDREDGFQFWGSVLFGDNGEMDLCVTYTLAFPGNILRLPSVTVVQRVKSRDFRGHAPSWGGSSGGSTGEGGDEQASSSEIVYVTEKGNAYHCREDCSYLKVKVQAVLLSKIDAQRNSSGGKYYLCEFCDHIEAGEYVYITSHGTSYHTEYRCRGIYHNILSMNLQEAVDRGYRRCSKCGAAEAGQ